MASPSSLKTRSELIRQRLLTFPPLFYLPCSLDCPHSTLLPVLFCSAPVEVFNNNTNKHVQHKEPNKEEERDEVQNTPFIIILPWLKTKYEQIMDEDDVMTCWSTPTASNPWYMISTHPSLDESTKRDINAWPRLSKLYFWFNHLFCGYFKQSLLVLMNWLAMSGPAQWKNTPLNIWMIKIELIRLRTFPDLDSKNPVDEEEGEAN